MALHQSWVHGNAFGPPEFPNLGQRVDNIPWTEGVGLRRGWGSWYQGSANTSNWFHVAIPTPAIIEGARVQLLRVFVLFSAGDPAATSPSAAGANVTDIHVWDGPNRIATFGGFRLFGNRRMAVGGNNTFTVAARPQIQLGVGISVQVSFSNTGEQLVGFSAAGADFDI